MKSRRGTLFLKVPLIVISIVVLCLGASIVLTDPSPATLPLRARDALAAIPGQWSTWQKAAATEPAPPSVVEEPVPRFSDSPFDDSGYQVAFRFSKPLADS